MKYLENFNRFPIENDVKKWEDYLDKNFSNFSNTQYESKSDWNRWKSNWL
jgi:hypothetical protein